MPWGAVAGAALSTAGSAASSGKGKKASKSAAAQQQAALQQALGTYKGMYGDIQGNTQPFIEGGQAAFGNLLQQLPQLTKPFDMTQAQLEQTPGYQFALGQGTKAIQNQMSAHGWGGNNSGPLAQGVGQFATGLADQTFGNQFQRYLDQNKQIASLLGQPVGYGLTANGQLTDAARGFAQMIGGGQTGIGNAGAAGTLAAGAAGQTGINGATGAINQLFQPGADGRTPIGQLINPNWTPSGSSTPSSSGVVDTGTF